MASLRLAAVLLVFAVLLLATATLAYQWTFMVYMAADNNLYPYAYQDLAEMMKVGSTKDVAVIVFFDSYNDTRNYIYFVEKGGLKLLANFTDLDTGDPATLEKFIINATKIAPAEHYCLVLWDHGGGWLGLCVDDDTGNYINITELQEALEPTGVHFDVVAFDACLMEMTEVAYQLMNCTDYVVGSEQVVPVYGYPYDTILATLTANPNMTGLDLAITFVKAYAQFYGQFTPGAYGYTQSAVATAAMPALRDAFNALAVELINTYELGGKYAAAIRRDRRRTTEFYFDSFVDAYDMASKLAADKRLPPSLRLAAAQVLTALNNTIVASWSSGITAFGLSIYYPSTSTDWYPRYLGTAWAKATLWDEWLQVFLGLI